MRAGAFLLALVWLAGPSALADTAVDRDAAVYADVFAALGGSPAHPTAIVVRDRTATVEDMTKTADTRIAAAGLRQRMPGASERLVDDLLAKARDPHALTKAQLAQATSVKADLVPTAAVRHAFDDPKVPIAEAWRRLAQEHGGARSVVTLSPVGYDDSTHSALVFLDVECGGLCGGGTLFRLEEKDGQWRVVESQPLWAS